MTINTQSGPVKGNARNPYMKWLQGWKDGGGWTGATTRWDAWDEAENTKPAGCSWYAYGLIMARSQRRGRQLEAKEWAGLRD